MRPIGELSAVLIEYASGLRFVTVEVTKRNRMLEGESQWLDRAVKAHEPHRARQISRGAQNGERVGGRTEADIPDHEFPDVAFQALAKLELIDVKGRRLGNGTNDRMKSLSVCK